MSEQKSGGSSSKDHFGDKRRNSDQRLSKGTALNRSAAGAAVGFQKPISPKGQQQNHLQYPYEHASTDPPHVMVSRAVTVSTPVQRASGLPEKPQLRRRPSKAEVDLDMLEAETSSILLSRFRRNSPDTWPAGSADETDLQGVPNARGLERQASTGSFQCSIPIPSSIRHSDRQFSIESMSSVGSIDSGHQLFYGSRRGSLQFALSEPAFLSAGGDDSSNLIDASFMDTKAPGFAVQRPLNVGRQSSLASLGGGSSTLSPTDLANFKISPTIEKSIMGLPFSSSAMIQNSMPMEDFLIPSNAKSMNGLAPILETGHELRNAEGLRPMQNFDSNDHKATTQSSSSMFIQRPTSLDRVSSANAYWGIHGYNSLGDGNTGTGQRTGTPAKPTHLKTRGRSRSNVTFSDPPAVEMMETNTSMQAACKPRNVVSRPEDGDQRAQSAPVPVGWGQPVAPPTPTSDASSTGLPSSALQEWLSGSPSPSKALHGQPSQPTAWNPWKTGSFPQTPARFESDMAHRYGSQGEIPPPNMMTHHQPPPPPHAAAFPTVPMGGWGPSMDRDGGYDASGQGNMQMPRRVASTAGPYGMYPPQGYFGPFPPAMPYKRSSSVPLEVGTMDHAQQQWSKMNHDYSNNNNNNNNNNIRHNTSSGNFGVNNSMMSSTISPSCVKRERSDLVAQKARRHKLLQFGHPYTEVMEGRKLYSRHTLFLLGAHRSDTIPINGNNADGCDSILVFRNSEEIQRKDDLAMLKFGCTSRSGGAALFTSHVKNLPVRVFRRSDNGGSQGFRYDGLYTVIAMFDDAGSPRSELPVMSHDRIEFLLRRNPNLRPKDMGATASDSNASFLNRLSIDELWDIVSREVKCLRDKQVANNVPVDKTTTSLPDHCSSSPTSTRPASVQKATSTTQLPSRPAALNVRQRATSAEVALLHIRYFSHDDGDDDDDDPAHSSRGGTRRESPRDRGDPAAKQDCPPSGKRQKQSHGPGTLSPEILSDAIGRLLNPDNNSHHHGGGGGGGCAETSFQTATVTFPPDGTLDQQR